MALIILSFLYNRQEVLKIIKGPGINQGIPVCHRPAVNNVCYGALYLLHVEGVRDVRHFKNQRRNMPW